MALLAIPNISEGRDRSHIERCAAAIRDAGCRVLDVHSDATHHRSVFTTTGEADALIDAMAALAVACKGLDLREHRGVHPRVGALDVCPFVPHGAPLAMAVDAARRAGTEIATRAALPVFFYGAAARTAPYRELPDLRRGGLVGLRERLAAAWEPDEGPAEIDPRWGVVCVGARGPLIALNVLLDCSLETARAIAAEVRDPGVVRALAFPVGAGGFQVSTNLLSPHVVGIEGAFEKIATAASARGSRVVATEIVGLVPEDFLPDPDATAARLLVEPGRSLEAALAR